ncbi:multidrug effflux MFS transporter [Sinomonas halotolerans]|uniref:Multidrug effflux MFS transporter n=1 Tax=Sinomonas halotolerans TaxID=1644133 RepID=A0ABU9X2P4_9MICC
MTATASPPKPTQPRAGRALPVVLGLLTAFGPISMDLYLPVLPALTADLGTHASTAQLTVSACLFGLAFGQLAAGPLSDRFGRRRPLLIGIVVYVFASLLCAVSPTVEVLIGARLLQGLAASVGIVTAQAAGRDLYSGGRLVRYYGRLAVLGGLAAIIGPVIGGQIALFTDWRGAFAFLAVAGTGILAASATAFPETLPHGLRTAGGLAPMMHGFRRLLADRTFTSCFLVAAFTGAALFAYLAGATYVLQGVYGLSPQEYALAFGLNSLGYMVFGFASGRASERWSEAPVLAVGLVMAAAGGIFLFTTAIAHLPVWALIVSLLVLVSGIAVTNPPSTSLALAGYPDMAGTASSLLGLARFGLGGVAAPLVGLGGSGDATALGVVAASTTAIAGLAFWASFAGLLGRPKGVRASGAGAIPAHTNRTANATPPRTRRGACL